jgi:FkbM family methyltransferase
MKVGGKSGTWIDVGAHRGDVTLYEARDNPRLRVFAIEPNVRAAARLVGAAANFLVFPIAIAEEDGIAGFHINTPEACSSLLPLNESSEMAKATGVEATVTVPTMRLDTFMSLVGIDKVDFLKIDAQGMDLAVLRSAGERLADIAKIQLEVTVSGEPQYVGCPSKEEVLSYLSSRGFELRGVQMQSEGREENLTFLQKGR